MVFANMSNALSRAPFPFPEGRLMPSDIIWTPARIREKLLASDVMLERSIVKIFERQTHAEQNAGVTVEHNGVGFTAFDAEFMTGLARRIQRPTNGEREGHRLSPAQRAAARNKMLKYSKQLAKIIDAERVTASACEVCGGSGDAGDPARPCSACRGTGDRL